MPELLILGPYNPEERTGPAIWLRCALAGTITSVQIPTSTTPILYLPDVKRQDLRAIDQCDESLKAIAELQFRGRFWCQENSKDWTLLAFFQSDQGGLGLDVARDDETFQASCSESQWKAFVALCKSNHQFHPEKDGIIAGLEKLANHEDSWNSVWNRYCDAPRKYPHIPERLKNLTAPDFEWFHTVESSNGAGSPNMTI